MPDLVVMDLGSQAEAVAQYVAGWPKSRFLSWLSQFGEVLKTDWPGDQERYSFHARSGRWTGFWFTENDRLEIPATSGAGHAVVSIPMEDDTT